MAPEFDILRKIEEMKENKRQAFLAQQEKDKAEDAKRLYAKQQKAAKESKEKSMFSSVDQSKQAGAKSASTDKVAKNLDTTEALEQDKMIEEADDYGEEFYSNEPPPLDINKI